MKIALVNLKCSFLTQPMMYPPLGLWYLAAQLENLGHNCDFFDLNEEDLPKDGDYDQLWATSTSSQMYGVKLLGRLVQTWTKTKSVLGGVAVTINPVACKDLGFNVIIIGEADHPERLAEVIQLAESGERNILLNKPTIPDLKHVLPPVRRWSYRYKAYLKPLDGKKYETATMFTSRGCPYTCSFCACGREAKIWTEKVRYESLPVVEAQLDEIAEQGYQAVTFYDDIMPLNKKRTMQMADMLHQRNLVWRVFLRSDIMCNVGGYDYLKYLRERGMVEVCCGVESADNRIKENISKGTTIEQDTQVLKWCKELDIQFKASMVIGLPGETPESLEKTRQWLLEHRPHMSQILHLIPFPGTPIAENIDKLDINIEIPIPEEQWYTGNDIPPVTTSTSALSSEDLRDFAVAMRAELTDAGVVLVRD